MRGHGSRSGGRWAPARRAAFALACVACVACGGALRVREPRAGVQRDAAGRPFVEVRRASASACPEAAQQGGAEGVARARLARAAQEQGYSGVVDVACAAAPSPACADGVACAGVALRYVIPAADGRVPARTRGGSCDPPCEGAARCQDGQCVAACEPPCAAGELCAPNARCEPASAPAADAAPAAR